MKPITYVDHVKHIQGEIEIGSIIKNTSYPTLSVGFVVGITTFPSGSKYYELRMIYPHVGASASWAGAESQLISCIVKMKQ